MSSIQAIHNQLNNIKHVVVCVDPVDLDNIWQCLWALVRAPNAHIHITLSPRVLDLRVPTFAELFEKLMAKVGSHYMLDVLEKNAEEVYDLLGDEDLRDYFARDATFQTDPHTRTHIALYMALSALRFALKFSSKGHASNRYTFYWDPRSMETIPGIHHPTHVNDYLYACSDEDRRESRKYLHLRGQEREEKMGAGRGDAKFGLGWGSIYGDDLDAAMEIENIVKKRAIPTWLFPTECAKAKVKGGEVLRACPWDFATEELIAIFKAAGDMDSYEQADAFTRETMTLAKMHMFDVLTVVPLALPSSLPYRRAVSYWDQVNGQRVIRIREAADGPINVFYPDEEAMPASKQMVMKGISHVLSPVSQK
ncbi:hypothetical protein DL771_010530 [Monosporascus sp. 5C6A]|nr:hypothetical protein DL771_010530 [Monosporascus sp. 5C6A]